MLQPFMDMMLEKWGASAGEAQGENEDDEVEGPDDGENEDDEVDRPADGDNDDVVAEASAVVAHDGDFEDDEMALLDPYPSHITSPVPTPSPAPICATVLRGSPARGPSSSTASSSDDQAPSETPAKKEHAFQCQLARKPAFTSLLTVASPQNAPTKAGATPEERLARLVELRMLSIIRFIVNLYYRTQRLKDVTVLGFIG